MVQVILYPELASLKVHFTSALSSQPRLNDRSRGTGEMVAIGYNRSHRQSSVWTVEHAAIRNPE
jgi:hypothetical protein